MIQKGAEVNARDNDGYTPLHRAVSDHSYRDKRELVELLLVNGADINVKNNEGLTPLHTAITFCGGKEKCDKKEMFDLLIGKGADINAKNKAGQTPLQMAEINNRTNMAEVLVAKKGRSQAV